jgi:hypothetical protein
MNSDVSNLNLQIVIILYSEHYYYDLYACTCEFSIRQESFDVILVNTAVIFAMGVLHLVSEPCRG